jgi:hypothetical protein
MLFTMKDDMLKMEERVKLQNDLMKYINRERAKLGLKVSRINSPSPRRKNRSSYDNIPEYRKNEIAKLQL